MRRIRGELFKEKVALLLERCKGSASTVGGEIRGRNKGRCVGGLDAGARRRLGGVVVVGKAWRMAAATRRSKEGYPAQGGHEEGKVMPRNNTPGRKQKKLGYDNKR